MASSIPLTPPKNVHPGDRPSNQ